ncbi:MAG: thiamine phosphate synthase [Xylanivirga thermophila]|jgi:thiamine-phosphate pyrophosphorylase|uniref:thiamine phosphate synthase n=1 Tax=Xylanivirga thermophila TaxID=2496273 RepID=UPI00101BCF8C|nr:thiamine phosphate synthase [Xylanivirga thermophila]
MPDKAQVDYTLYLVTDRSLIRDVTLEQAVEQAILGGATLVQLREKDIDTLEFYNIAKRVKTITDRYNIPLIINDRLDIALAVESAGLHVGQKDMPAKIARKLLGPDRILGVSATTLDEAVKAENDGADYIGVGAIFATNTKDDAEYVSLEELKTIKRKVKIPVVAIGGINENNVGYLKDTDIDGIAVVSAILSKEDIKKTCLDFKGKIGLMKEKI